MGHAISRLDSVATNELKVALPTHRFGISARQGVAGAALAAAVCALLWFKQPDLPPPIHQPSTTPVAAATPSELVVSIQGAVERPGLYTFAPGARIADALSAAGPTGDTMGLNHAQLLADATQIIIPEPGAGGVAEPSSSSGSGSSSGTWMGEGVSLNQASVEELMTLPGVGQKTAQAIVDYRDQIGAFQSIEQLQEVKGIGPAKFAAIAAEVRL